MPAAGRRGHVAVRQAVCFEPFRDDLHVVEDVAGAIVGRSVGVVPSLVEVQIVDEGDN
jgi:hypothetical protein